MKPVQILNQQKRFFQSFNSLANQASRAAASNQHRLAQKNNIQQQFVLTKPVVRAFGGKNCSCGSCDIHRP